MFPVELLLVALLPKGFLDIDNVRSDVWPQLKAFDYNRMEDKSTFTDRDGRFGPSTFHMTKERSLEKKLAKPNGMFKISR